jgi:hypothetical protein
MVSRVSMSDPEPDGVESSDLRDDLQFIYKHKQSILRGGLGSSD